MCLVDELTKYGDDRSTFEILSPDNGIPLKNLGLNEHVSKELFFTEIRIFDISIHNFE